MQFYVTKTGLEIFDANRAYGLAQLLHTAAGGKWAPTVVDSGGVFSIETPTELKTLQLKSKNEWRAIFAEDNWQKIFLTYKSGWISQRNKVKKTLERHADRILVKAAEDGLAVDFNGGSTLPGPLDPAAFKGLRGLTAGDFSPAEAQTKVDELNWAVACIGAAMAQRYRFQKTSRQYFVTLPIPRNVRFADFHTVRHLVYQQGLAYNGVRNAAAHFSLVLANAVREKAQGNPHFPVQFSNVLYFSLFQSRQQFKPSIGGAVGVARLIDLALARPAVASQMFTTWDYLFHRGSTKGNEDLAMAITELVMAPSLDTYYRHVRLFSRYVVDPKKGVKHENLYSEEGLREVMAYVAA